MLSSEFVVFCLLFKNVNVYHHFICCFVWALPQLREEHKLGQFGNRIKLGQFGNRILK
jgi:hypothetical protein